MIDLSIYNNDRPLDHLIYLDISGGDAEHFINDYITPLLAAYAERGERLERVKVALNLYKGCGHPVIAKIAAALEG